MVENGFDFYFVKETKKLVTYSNPRSPKGDSKRMQGGEKHGGVESFQTSGPQLELCVSYDVCQLL